MGKLTKANPSARELVTEILDKVLWWNTLKVIVQFLHTKNVEQVRVVFGFVLERDLEGKRQAQNQTVQLSDLVSFIQRGLEEGTIECARGLASLTNSLCADVRLL